MTYGAQRRLADVEGVSQRFEKDNDLVLHLAPTLPVGIDEPEEEFDDVEEVLFRGLREDLGRESVVVSAVGR